MDNLLHRQTHIPFTHLAVTVTTHNGVRGRLGTVKTEHWVASAEAELDHNKLVGLDRM